MFDRLGNPHDKKARQPPKASCKIRFMQLFNNLSEHSRQSSSSGTRQNNFDCLKLGQRVFENL